MAGWMAVWLFVVVTDYDSQVSSKLFFGLNYYWSLVLVTLHTAFFTCTFYFCRTIYSWYKVVV